MAAVYCTASRRFRARFHLTSTHARCRVFHGMSEAFMFRSPKQRMNHAVFHILLLPRVLRGTYLSRLRRR